MLPNLTCHSCAAFGAHTRLKLKCFAKTAQKIYIAASVVHHREVLQRREAEVAELRGESLALAQAEALRQDEELRVCQAQARNVHLMHSSERLGQTPYTRGVASWTIHQICKHRQQAAATGVLCAKQRCVLDVACRRVQDAVVDG